MNFDGNFKPICHGDISVLKKMVGHLTERHWNFNITRQDGYVADLKTQTVSLVDDLDFRHINPTKQPALDVFGPLIQPILQSVSSYFESQPSYQPYFEKYGPGYFIRVNIVKLFAGETIERLQDKNFSLAHSHKIYLPIITNSQVLFTVGSETKHLIEGKLVEINNRRFYSVANNSTEDSIHMVFDWVVPGEPCCCSNLTHPGVMCTPQLCQETDQMQIECHCIAEK